jgi:hypothetical protein
MTIQLKPAILLFLSICVFTISCKKDHNEISSLPTTLYFKTLILNDTIKVYTREGEVKDPAVKAHSIIATGVGLVTPLPNSSNYVTFLSNNSFLLYTDHYDFQKTNDRFVFNYIDSFRVSPEDLLIAPLPFYKYPTARKNSAGNLIYRRQFVGYGDYTSLKISGMDYGILKRDTITRAILKRIVGYELNEFNAEGINSLGKYDTIAVKEYSFQYELRK